MCCDARSSVGTVEVSWILHCGLFECESVDRNQMGCGERILRSGISRFEPPDRLRPVSARSWTVHGKKPLATQLREEVAGSVPARSLSRFCLVAAAVLPAGGESRRCGPMVAPERSQWAWGQGEIGGSTGAKTLVPHVQSNQ